MDDKYITNCSMFSIKKTETTSAHENYRERGTHSLQWECKGGMVAVETDLEVSSKNEKQNHHIPSIPLLGTYPKKTKSLCQELHLYSHVNWYENNIIAKVWKQSSVSGQMNGYKECGIKNTMKEEEILSFMTTCIQLGGHYVSEISQREKGNGITYIWNIYLKKLNLQKQ